MPENLLPLEEVRPQVVATDAAVLVASQVAAPDRHPAAVYLARLSPSSRRTMREALDTIAGLLTGGGCDAQTLRWEAMRYQHAAAVRAVLMEQYAPATANRMLSALRGVMEECWNLELIGAEDCQRVVKIKGISGQRLPSGRRVEYLELKALCEVCEKDETPAGVRDAALITMLYFGGLRRAEAVAINLADYDPAGGDLKVLWGKGNKQRMVYITNEGQAVLGAWIELRSREPGALLCPVRKGGTILIRRMTDQAVLYILRKRGNQAGLNPFTPHDFRRTAITTLIEAGEDLVTVQKWAGHADPRTTAAYDRRGEEAKRQAAQRLHLPFRRWGAARSED